MDKIDQALIDLLYKLLPGLMAAAVFHSITPYPKRDIFDRVVNALIFTAIGQMGVSVVRPMLLWIGANLFALGEWSPESALWISTVVAVLGAVVLAVVLNTDWLHEALRNFGITKRVALPDPWYSAHTKKERYVTIALKDGRRIFGWPKEWPDNPKSGHYVLTESAWVLNDGIELRQYDVEATLIDVQHIERVDFMRFADDECVVENTEYIEQSRSKLIQMQSRGESDG